MATQAVPATPERRASVIGIANGVEAARDTAEAMLPVRPLGVPPRTDAERLAELASLARHHVEENGKLRRLRAADDQTIAALSARLADGHAEYPLAESVAFDRCGELGRLLTGLARGHRVFIRLNNESLDEQPTAVIVGVRVPFDPTASRVG